MPWHPDIPRVPCPRPGGPINVTAAVVHDTIGYWPGDMQYVARNSLAHFTIGPNSGQWAQHADTNAFLAHCNGANRRTFGIEFSAEHSGQLLTGWQCEAWGRIAYWALQVHGIPLAYLDPETVPNASVHVNSGGWGGWISHRSVRTDDGSYQHTDYVNLIDWFTAIGRKEEALHSREDDELAVIKKKNDAAVYTTNWVQKRHIQTMKELDIWKFLGAGIMELDPEIVDSIPTVK